VLPYRCYIGIEIGGGALDLRLAKRQVRQIGVDDYALFLCLKVRKPVIQR
jgi:hypothetical protein